MLPILAEAGAHYGVEPMAIARASLMGQPVHLLSPLVPSTYLLVSLAGVDLADHQRFTLLPAAAVGIVMTLVTGISLFGGTFLMPIFLGQIRGYSSAEVGTTMLISGLVMFVSAPLAGRAFAPVLLAGLAVTIGPTFASSAPRQPGQPQ